MTRSAIRRWAARLLIVLPVLVFAGWLVVEQGPVWFSPIPAWLQPNNADATVGACEALSSLAAFGGEFLAGADGATLSPAEARAAAEAVVARHYDLPPGTYTQAAEPALVRASFPDAGPRLAWLSVAVLEAPAEYRPGKVAVVYVDAQSGDLLALVTGSSATTPQDACGRGPVSRRAIARQYLPLIALAGYLLLLGVGAVARHVWKRRRTRPTHG